MDMETLFTRVEKMLNDYASVLDNLWAQDLLGHVYDEIDGNYDDAYDATLDEINTLLEDVTALHTNSGK